MSSTARCGKKIAAVAAMLTVTCLRWGGTARGQETSTDAALSTLAAESGIDRTPVPHRTGTAPIELPHDLPRPEEMTYPKEGSIFVEQLREANVYFSNQIAKTPGQRHQAWRPDYSSEIAYRKSLAAHGENLCRMLGWVHPISDAAAQVQTLAEGPVHVDDVRLEIAEGFEGRAMVFVPAAKVRAAVVAIPDAQESREQFAGIALGAEPAAWLRALLARGVAVAVPITIERTMDYPYGERNKVDRRLLIYRLGFIVGRTLVGMEVQQAESFGAYLQKRLALSPQQLGVLGRRQGGMTALYAGATCRWGAVGVVDYFERRENCWQEPPDRMLYGQLNEFGDAEVAGLLAPTPLQIVTTAGGTIASTSVDAESARARRFYAGLGQADRLRIASATGEAAALQMAAEDMAATLGGERTGVPAELTAMVTPEDVTASRNQHFEAWHEYLKRLDIESDRVRQAHWNLLETPPAERVAKGAELRKELTSLMGTVDLTNGPLRPQTQVIRITDKFVAYNVLLDVVPGVHAYGQLLVPRGAEGRLPVVVCQHGLGGRPADITGIGENPDTIYHALGAHLADLGYVVFAPYVNVPIRQEILVNPLVRQAAALGMMRTSLELAKLHRIIDFLDTQSYVDPNRIAYYGLSYGGYSAIWMPPLEPRIKASVISGHFNDWRQKISSEEYSGSYLRYQDADFYNWNVLDRFTHVELIAAMYPRPVCVEFGQRDPTTTPEWHERAWAQVEQWKQAWGLGGLKERVTRVHFEGPHEIHGVGTVAFVNRFLRPEIPDGRDHSYNLLPVNIELGAKLPAGSLATGQDSMVPFDSKELDASPGNRIDGRFYVAKEYPAFAGMEFQLSRVGDPGDLLVRFGTAPGADDLGEARLSAAQFDPVYVLWYSAKIKPVHLDPSKLYYFQVSTTSGVAPHHCYLLYGPRPLGGIDEPSTFGLSYQVLAEGEPAKFTQHYERFGFMREMLADDDEGPAIPNSRAPALKPDEIPISGRWSINPGSNPDEVVVTAAKDLSKFFKNALGLNVNVSTTGSHPQIQLAVEPEVDGVNTAEGFRVTVSKDQIRVEGTTSRGVMRGVYALETAMRERQRASLERGVMMRNARFTPRITTGVHAGQAAFDEPSFPIMYTDGLLDRISHSGFNTLWVHLNTEESTFESTIYPELNDPEAATRLARLQDLAHRAQRYGIDIYIYLSTGYAHHLPESFFAHHPDARGVGWGPPMCTSNETVRQYYTETVHTIFHRAPALRGIIVIYDSEGFWYCGNSARNLKQCPRCSHFTQEQVAAQLLSTLNQAMHEAGGPDKQFIAWNYNVASQWVVRLFPLLPKDITVQGDFDKAQIAEKDGIRSETEDYNISTLGPSDLFVDEYRAARAAGLKVMAKTEHAVSQEFILVPYIPCMDQWYKRIAKIREYDLSGFFGNWNHYGYTPSLPADLVNRMSFDPAPSEDKLLNDLATKRFGREAAPYVLRAWNDFSDGIREFPYSDPVARTPGPVQKGPSQPLFLDPSVKGFGPWRSWQNDLNWTKPWGTAIAEKYLTRLKDDFAKGDAELEAAQRVAPEPYRTALAGEWRVGETIQRSVQTVLHLITWIELRDQFFAAGSQAEKEQIARKLEAVALDERLNAKTLLPSLFQDSRLGYAVVSNGGLFTPSLVQWKIGFVDDVLLRQLPEALKSSPK